MQVERRAFLLPCGSIAGGEFTGDFYMAEQPKVQEAPIPMDRLNAFHLTFSQTRLLRELISVATALYPAETPGIALKSLCADLGLCGPAVLGQRG